MPDRRNFLKKSGLLAGAGLWTPDELLASRRKPVSALETMNFGVIGCYGMGWSDMRAHLAMDDVDCVALCDVDDRALELRSGNVETLRGHKPATYEDYRKLRENPDVDAVIIGTPDHWHCKILLDALDAGKHVYCEKPLANSIQEANVMLAAAKKSDRLIQIGQWQRSGPHYAQAIDMVRSGKLGNIRLVKVWAYQGWMKPVPVKPDSDAPDFVDYDMWLGPAPKRPFNENRFHFTFRWFWDYAGGLMTDWGVHEIDIALYAMNAIAPKSVMAGGGKLAYPDDASETPDTLQTVFEYDNFNMLWEHATGIDGGPYGRTEGIAFIGNNGTVVVNRDGWELIPEQENGAYKMEAIPMVKRPNGANYVEMHAKNFVECIRNNTPDQLNTGIESGSVAAINAHMGNVAYKTGRKVYWDADAGNFGNDAEANALIGVEYHNGWSMD